MFLRKGQRRRNSWEAARRAGTLLVLTFLIANPGVRGAGEKVKELQDRFDKEARADGKIKTLEKLSLAQFEVADQAGKTQDFSAVGLIFEKYRDNVRTAFELLRKQEPDADRHSKYYRQLELELRRGIRETEETMLIAPQEVRPPLDIVHTDLLRIDDELINLLFPRRTKDPVKVPPAGEAPKP